MVALVFLAAACLSPAAAQGQDTVAVDARKAEIAAEPLAVRYRALALGMVSSATWTQAMGVPEGWDRTWQGYANRLGDQLGFGVSEEVLRLGLEHATHWRSVTPACEGARSGRPFVARFGAATRCGLSSTFVAQNRAGERRPNVPLLGAVVAASALSLTWRPERKSAHKGQLFMVTRVGIVTGAMVFNRGLKVMRKR
ncbi:hypothetical protein GEMMAAP_01695 [Gemmatimonas phototrophica]|uniref:Uncharacterized protein n=1 Tax=Gemmatimonas phototrophica TaxID=1379270 RepID=A0A143BH16_9BACT|nr:hypothetical protein GEMMAAP_01695 [Gemmatimonas phototrophica]